MAKPLKKFHYTVGFTFIRKDDSRAYKTESFNADSSRNAYLYICHKYKAGLVRDFSVLSETANVPAVEQLSLF